MREDFVLVLGASSLVGRHVVSRLVADGRQVVAVSRSARTSDADGVRWVQADVTSPDGLVELPRGTDAISTLPIWLTADVAPHLAERGYERIVAFSSSSAVTKAEASDAGERDLSARLVDGERRLASLAPALVFTILRPSMIYGGPGDANIERIASLVKRARMFPLVGNGSGRRQPVHADDLASAAIAALATDVSIGRTYVLAGGEEISVRDLVARTARVNGLRVHFVRVPARATTWALRAFSSMPGSRKVPAGAVERLARDLTFDNGPARRDLGFAPRGFSPPDYRLP